MQINQNLRQALYQENVKHLPSDMQISKDIFCLEKLEKILQSQDALNSTTLAKIDSKGSFNSKLNPNIILHALEQGVSLVVDGIHAFDDDLEELRQEFIKTTQCPCNINCYLTPLSAQCFNPHYDDHEVVIIQCQGSKSWSVESQPSLKNPTQPKSISKNDYEFIDGIEINLNPGDFLYIPFGHIHQAQTNNSFSLHLTVGIHKMRGIDYIIKLLQDQSESEAYALLREPIKTYESSQLLDLANCMQELISQQFTDESLSLHLSQWKREFMNQLSDDTYKPQIQSLLNVMLYDPKKCSNIRLRGMQYLEVKQTHNIVILKKHKRQVSIPIEHWPIFSKLFNDAKWIRFGDLINGKNFMIYNHLLEKLILNGFVECLN